MIRPRDSGRTYTLRRRHYELPVSHWPIVLSMFLLPSGVNSRLAIQIRRVKPTTSIAPVVVE
jgi:hypothetical protein